ncbi:MAG: hypothetical protein ABI334_10700 [Candidatus Dormiibacterota bacterium]
MATLEVNVRSASRDWWRKFHEYRRLRQLEWRPDDPLLPDELFEAHVKRDSPLKRHSLFCIESGDQIVSVLETFAHRPGSPQYEGNKQFLDVEGAVLEQHRRQGLGRSWLPVVARVMDQYGCTVLTVSTDEGDGHRFLKGLGAEPRLTDRESRLDFTKVDWSMVRKWVEEGAQRNPRTELVLYENRVPADVLPEYARALTEMVNTAPMEELEHGAEVFTPESAEDFFSRIAVLGGVVHTYIAREADGAIAGLTTILFIPFEVDRIQQAFTGVGTDYRGRGLGKWAKASMLLYVVDRYPQTRWVVTGNAGSNEPMLGINHKLGFRPYRESVVYQLTRKRLDSGPRASASR